MGCNKYPHMFAPMTIRASPSKNRVLASPITTNRIVDHGYPTPEGIDVYETRPGAASLRSPSPSLHRPRVFLAS